MNNNFVFENASPHYLAEVASIYNEYIAVGEATMEEKLYDEKRINEWIKKSATLLP